MTYQLIIFDLDRKHAAALSLYLERLQLKIHTAESSEQLLSLMEQRPAEFLLAVCRRLDDALITVLTQLKKEFPHTQIILAADEEHLDNAMRALRTQVFAYLPRPIKSQALELTLQQAGRTIWLTGRLEHYKQRNEALKNAQNLYQQLFDEVPCYISVQDRDFRLTATNRKFKQDFGDEIGSYCYEVYKHRSARCETCPVASTFQDGRPHQTEEVVTSKAGKQYNVLTWTAPIRDAKGEITQVMEMSTNITQIRQLQDHLVSLGLMLGSMSHGVKGMLTAMDGGIYQLESGLSKNDPLRTERAFEQIKLVAERIRKMVLEILYYAKSRELRYTAVDVAAFIEQTLDAARPMAEKNQVPLKAEISPDMGTINVDPNWVQAALVNFLENAIDACTYDRSKTEHQVLFTVFPLDPDRLCFIIQDNGMGMDRETQEKMFTLFFTSKGSQGTGLGLFIANRVIQQHGGSIQVESKPQEGSRFVICLPRKRPDPSPVIDFPPRAPGQNEIP